MRVTQDDTNLRRGSTLLGQLADLLDDLLGGGLQPRRGSARVGNRGGRNALALAVKSTHLGGVVVVLEMLEFELSTTKLRLVFLIVWSKKFSLS